FSVEAICSTFAVVDIRHHNDRPTRQLSLQALRCFVDDEIYPICIGCDREMRTVLFEHSHGKNEYCLAAVESIDFGCGELFNSVLKGLRPAKPDENHFEVK